MKLITPTLLALLAQTASADPIGTVWKTEAERGAYAHIETYACGGKLCGRVKQSFEAGGQAGSDEVGTVILQDMVPDESGQYEGRLFDPRTRRSYLGRARFAGDLLELKGCVAGGVVCLAQTWTRVN